MLHLREGVPEVTDDNDPWDNAFTGSIERLVVTIAE